MSPRRPLRSALLAAARSVWKLRPLERFLVQRTIGHPYEGLVSKLPPLWSSYTPGRTIRRVQRDRINLELDLSELAEWYAYWGFENPSLKGLLRLCESGMTVLDVGSHIGLFALSIAQAVGPTGHVHAVEPDAINHAKFLRELALNPDLARRIIVHNVAISDASETLRLTNPLPNNRSPRISATGEAVEAITLDALGATPDLVKLDIEGCEMKAIAGAAQVLDARPILFVEADDELLRAAGSSVSELLAALTRRGYRVVDQRTGQPPALPLEHSDLICSPDR